MFQSPESKVTKHCHIHTPHFTVHDKWCHSKIWILILFVKGQDVLNINSTYAPHVGLNDQTKREFWEILDDII